MIEHYITLLRGTERLPNHYPLHWNTTYDNTIGNINAPLITILYITAVYNITGNRNGSLITISYNRTLIRGYIGCDSPQLSKALTAGALADFHFRYFY